MLSLVRLSVLLVPLSLAVIKSGVARALEGVVSIVKLSVELVRLVLVDLAATVWEPSAKAELGVIM